jgi:hypothetical protein
MPPQFPGVVATLDRENGRLVKCAHLIFTPDAPLGASYPFLRPRTTLGHVHPPKLAPLC